MGLSTACMGLGRRKDAIAIAEFRENARKVRDRLRVPMLAQLRSSRLCVGTDGSKCPALRS